LERIELVWNGALVLDQRCQTQLLLSACSDIVKEVARPATSGWQHVHRVHDTDRSTVEVHEYHTQSIIRALVSAAIVLSDRDLWYSDQCVRAVLVVCFFQQLRVLHMECDGFWKPQLLDMLHLVPLISYRSLRALNHWVIDRMQLDAWHSDVYDAFAGIVCVFCNVGVLDV
jgi:hypothetical protein